MSQWTNIYPEQEQEADIGATLQTTLRDPSTGGIILAVIIPTYMRTTSYSYTDYCRILIFWLLLL